MKAVVHLHIEIPFEVSDNGYLGTTSSSIEEHIKAAKEEVQRHQVYLKSNTDQQPKLIKNAVFKVDKVELIP